LQEGTIFMTAETALPVGIEDFETIRRENLYYIDKTGLIKNLLENKSYVTLFTRPRRFGKTLMMSMLKYFFEINPQFSGRAKKGDGVSLNKNLLISQLVYYTRLSTNKNFLADVESLKGFFKQYKGKILSGISSVYPTC